MHSAWIYSIKIYYFKMFILSNNVGGTYLCLIVWMTWYAYIKPLYSVYANILKI